MNEVNTSGRIRMEPNPHLSQKTHTLYMEFINQAAAVYAFCVEI